MSVAVSTYPGERLGLPETGVCSVASMGQRVLGFVVDLVLSALAGWVITHPAAPQNLALAIWAGLTVVTVGLFGATPGDVLAGVRVASTGGHRFVGLWAVLRTALIFVIVPVLFTDADGRGLHDRICRTVVIRSR